MKRIVRRAIHEHTTLSAPEKAAIERALDAGEQYGYGNVMAWLATEWACSLRDDWGLPEKVAIDAVSGRGPYPLPSNATAHGRAVANTVQQMVRCPDWQTCKECCRCKEPHRHEEACDVAGRPCGRTCSQVVVTPNDPAVARQSPQAGGSASRCPACGLGEHGKDALCDHHYAEYLGQQLGSHSDVPDDGQTRYTPNDAAQGRPSKEGP